MKRCLSSLPFTQESKHKEQVHGMDYWYIYFRVLRSILNLLISENVTEKLASQIDNKKQSLYYWSTCNMWTAIFYRQRELAKKMVRGETTIYEPEHRAGESNTE